MPTAYDNVGEVVVTRTRAGSLSRWRFVGVTRSSDGIAQLYMKDSPIHAELVRVVTTTTSGQSTATSQSVALIDEMQSDQLLALVSGKGLNAISRVALHESVIAGVQSRPLVVSGPQAFRLTVNANEAVTFEVVIEGWELA